MKTIILFLTLLLFINGCGNICEYEIIQDLPSPDNKFKAVAAVENCGATTPFCPVVDILPIQEVLREGKPGNVFIGSHSRYIDVAWKDKSTLIVRHSCKKEDIVKQEPELYGIHIIYEEQVNASTY